LFYEPENAGMERFVKIGDVFVRSVYSNSVLDKVIGSDAEKIHLGRQHVRNGDGGRDFYHYSEGHILIERDSFSGQLRLHLF